MIGEEVELLKSDIGEGKHLGQVRVLGREPIPKVMLIVVLEFLEALYLGARVV